MACRRRGFTRVRVRAEGLNPYEIWSGLRKSDTAVDRVTFSYALNRRMSSGVAPRMIKGAANALLTISRLGEALKCTAEKPEGVPASPSNGRSS